MGIDEILRLIETMQQTDIQELEIANGDWKVRIARSLPHQTHSVANGNIPVMVSAPAPSVIAPSPEPVSEKVSPSKSGYVEVASPMVGTFYRASEPGAEPFVHENDMVSPGQTLCIIEAMKLMNDIPSEIKGKVVKVLVENAQPVEFGQPLFLLEPV